MIVINQRNGVPFFRQIREQIREQILTGKLNAGDQLPSVSKLSEELKINPMTISKAYVRLEEMDGLVERRPGIGLFVLPLSKEAQMAQKELLKETLERTATTANELGLSEDEAVEMFREALKRLKTSR